jgi:hypothetical protein
MTGGERKTMPDREKVINGLETCIKYIDRECPISCPYHEICTKYDGRVVVQPVLRDALALLKELERTGHWEGPECSSCHGILIGNVFPRPRYCPNCGAHMLRIRNELR